MSSFHIIEENDIPYSVAKEILQSFIQGVSSSSLLQKTFEYLNALEKCTPENARKLMEDLSQFVQKKEVRAMISSLCPENADELRAILVMEGRTLSQENIEKILNLIKSYKNN
ncbi:DNA-directed RNA polymerase subunit F [Metallosphaera tengchongensis]|uniref:DNA-directed RNA polymerase subunit Rpo4 n=1 Tax=Metallosphaera tengchongensis TaxID=1532350 RepID=A0A6N0NUQ3_9CREN|nr:RNA polymerase Rpb4 family protein [Metallosphaera tengchongensis]QKQ99894.1 DNA-directed RNA polymerase subunit F [Metallosphaera tengchongensis]